MADNKEARKRAQRTRRNIKRAITTVVILVIIGGVVMAAMPRPVVVEHETVERGELVVTVNEDGRTRVKDRYIVSAPLTGKLGRIELRSGDEVKQGAILARLVPLSAPLLDARSKSETQARVAAARAGIKQVQAQIERAQAAKDFADAEAERLQGLLASGAISQLELDRAMLEKRARAAELTSAKFAQKVSIHELQMARAALGHFTDKHDDMDQLTVPSPITGRVLKVIQQSEGVIQAGTPLLEIGDPKALEIVVDVLTTDAVHIRPGSPTTVEEWGGPHLAAAVRMIEPSAFTRLSALGVEEQRVNALIDLNTPYKEWEKLGDGYRVEARIETFRQKDAVKAPQSSLFRHGQSWAVFVMKDGTAQLRSVELGHRNDHYAAVLKGLEAGEEIIVHPGDKVVDGVEVRDLKQK